MTAYDMLTKLIKNTAKFSISLLFILFFFQPHIYSNESVAIEIDKPKFSEKGLNNRLYEIKAEKGIQTENNLELFIVEGKLRTGSGIWIYLDAKKGNFNQIENLIELSGEINFYTDEEDNFSSDHALFSINNDLLKFNSNVKHIRGKNVIMADESRMTNNFSHIFYEGNVSTLYVIE